MCIAATYTYTGGALIDTPAQRSDAQPLVKYEKHLPKEKNQNLGNDIQWPMDFYVCGIIRCQNGLSFCQIYFLGNEGVAEADRNVLITRKAIMTKWARF